MSKDNRYIYLKINSNIFRLLTVDYLHKENNPSVFEVMVWKDDLSYKFESNELSDKVLENYEIYSFKAYENPEELIDPELLEIIKGIKRENKAKKELAKEDLLELLDCNYIYVALQNCDFGDVSDYFIISLEIDKLTSTGIVVKENEYEVTFIPYEGFKDYWAMNRKDLE